MIGRGRRSPGQVHLRVEPSLRDRRTAAPCIQGLQHNSRREAEPTGSTRATTGSRSSGGSDRGDRAICFDTGPAAAGAHLFRVGSMTTKIWRWDTSANEVQFLIREGVEDGSIRACDDLLVANLLFGAFNHLTSRWWSSSGSNSLETVASTYFDVVMGGLNPSDGVCKSG